MHFITALRRVADAVITALAVVVGLTPDPTRVPVPVERDDIYRR